MKKLFLLFSIAIACLSARSQGVTFTASPTSQNSGNNVTLTSNYETTTGYVSNIASISSSNSNVTATIVPGSVSFGYGNTPTTLVITVSYPSGTGPVPVTFTVVGTLSTGTSDYTNQQFTVSTVNVAPAVATQTTYYNIAESGTFIEQSCGAKSLGSTVTYTVPASRYTSTVSQADANNKAINDVNANGQNYANAHGTCTAVYARLVGSVRTGDGSNVVLDFYSDPGFSNALAIPSQVTVWITWVKYAYAGSTGNNTTQNFVQSYTVPAGSTSYYLGHRQFFATNPPGNSGPYSDVCQSVILQTDNANFTTGANVGTFTNN